MPRLPDDMDACRATAAADKAKRAIERRARQMREQERERAFDEFAHRLADAFGGHPGELTIIMCNRGKR